MELTKEDLLYLYNQEKWIEGYWGSCNDEWLTRLEEEMIKQNMEIIPCYYHINTFIDKNDGFSKDNHTYCKEECYLDEQEWLAQRKKEEVARKIEQQRQEEWDEKIKKMEKEMEEHKKRMQEEKDREPKFTTYQLLKDAGMFDTEEEN